MPEAKTSYTSKQNTQIINPFPGLRPFSIEESHLFFGREGQSDVVLNHLAKNRFVAVIGASGSGKSSLMYCGVVPVLNGGFITEAGSRWKIITTRPGSAPISNLAESILKCEKEQLPEEEDLPYRKSIISSILRSSSHGLAESIKQLHLKPGENILLLVDQFEELFRYKSKQGDSKSFNESLAFVKLLVETIKNEDIPVYVVLTMRSDFIGECSQYQELTELINTSHYLIPQMTRGNFREAIVGPVAVGGGKISERLVHQLLNDVGDNPDQLPILQHALMRTWDYWIQNRKQDDEIDIIHYEAIGRMESALSEHANEAYNELNENQKELCESMFKTLTEKGGDNRGIRHPSSVEEIAAIALVSEKEVIKVADIFRASGRSFINPSPEMKLTGDSIIDISHESLMRIWDKLKLWVEEESAAIQMYLRLSEAAAMYQKGETGLWRPPDLHMATGWREKKNPTLTWAQRYAPAFERTMVYLETSEKEYQAEEENKIRLQKRALRRSRIVALVLGVAAVFALVATVWSYIQTVEAQDARKKAEDQKNEAEIAKADAEKQEKKARKQFMKAEKGRLDAEKQKSIAEKEKERAEIEKAKAVEAAQLALRMTNEAETQREIALNKSKEATEQKNIAEKASKQAYNLRMLSISQSMAVKSQQMSKDTTTKALVAYQAYQFNKDYNGEPHNNDVYNGLYYSLKLMKSNDFNTLKGHTDAVRAVQYIPFTNTLISAGSDGKIMKWNMDNSRNPEIIYDGKSINRSLAISAEGKYLACGTDDNLILVFDLSTGNSSPAILKGHTGAVWSLAFMNNKPELISSGTDSTVRIWNIASSTHKIIANPGSRVYSVAVTSDDQTIAGCMDNGKIILWKGENYEPLTIYEELNNPVLVAAFNHKGNLLAAGDKQGNVIVWDMTRRRMHTRLGGHNARISAVRFNNTDDILASASFDGTIQLWTVENFGNQPIILKDHESWVNSITFSPDNRVIMTGCINSFIKEWPLKTKYLARMLESEIPRNMTKREWELYVGKDIPYERTIIKLPKGKGIREEK